MIRRCFRVGKGISKANGKRMHAMRPEGGRRFGVDGSRSFYGETRDFFLIQYSRFRCTYDIDPHHLIWIGFLGYGSAVWNSDDILVTMN